MSKAHQTPAHGIRYIVKDKPGTDPPPVADTDGAIAFEAAMRLAKRWKIAGPIIGLVMAAGGASGGIYATTDRSKTNSAEVEHLKLLEPRVEQNAHDLSEIRGSVEVVRKSVSAVEDRQKKVLAGIEELKSENINRLKEELSDAKRELRKRDR